MLDRLRRQGHPVVLDLTEITFIDSSGLTALMDAHLAAENDGWSFAIRRVSPAVRRVFDLAGVQRLLDE